MSPRLREQVQAACKTKGNVVKKSAKSDKRAFVEESAGDAERVAARGILSVVYRITKQLSGKNTNQSAPVKDKDGNNLTTEQEQAAGCVQHFREALSHTPPDDPADPPPADIALDIDTSTPTEVDVRLSIKAMNCRKASCWH